MLNFKDWLMSEMPITRFDRIGDWNPNSKSGYNYSKQDVGILTNPNAVEKIHKSWSNTKQNFDLYFVRQKGAGKTFNAGQVTPKYVKENLGLDIQPNPNAITVIYTNNKGSDKIPMTSWAIAHRLGHAMVVSFNTLTNFRTTFNGIIKDFKKILNDVYHYEKPKFSYHSEDEYSYARKEMNYLKSLAQSVGTMRSARQNNLSNAYEFVFELLAQYLITGKIKFKPLSRFLVTGNYKAWGHPAPRGRYSRLDADTMEYWNSMLQDYARKYEHWFDSDLEECVGKIFIM